MAPTRISTLRNMLAILCLLSVIGSLYLLNKNDRSYPNNQNQSTDQNLWNLQIIAKYYNQKSSGIHSVFIANGFINRYWWPLITVDLIKQIVYFNQTNNDQDQDLDFSTKTMFLFLWLKISCQEWGLPSNEVEYINSELTSITNCFQMKWREEERIERTL